ncbi:hypothetical protein CKA32_001836 [Geitlerinema sp. FC II]|nr:hypothetical protein CKA32_001836 [Geitlerinema sp. FC II]
MRSRQKFGVEILQRTSLERSKLSNLLNASKFLILPRLGVAGKKGEQWSSGDKGDREETVPRSRFPVPDSLSTINCLHW